MIVIRRARMSDVSFVRRLTLDTVAYGVSELRDISNSTIQESAQPYLEELPILIHRKQDMAFLIAVDDEVDAPVGFLILEYNHMEDSTGEPQSYIANLAVLPEYWGRYVVHHLVKEAAKLTAQKGYRYMTSKITASNRRTVIQAQRLGFEIERYQMTMACNLEGVAKMPGRPPQEKAHDLSRLPEARRRRGKGRKGE